MNHCKPSCHCYPIMTALLIACLASNLRCCIAADENTSKAKLKTSELSVAPSSHREFPAERPAWVEAEPNLAGDVHRWPVTSTPCRSDTLCDEGLKVSLRAAVETYIETITGEPDSSSQVQFDDDWINRHCDKTKTYLGTVTTGNELMYESATVLVFNKEDRKQIEQQWKRHQVGQRLAILGVLSGGTVSIFISIAAVLCMVTRRAEQRVAGSAGTN